MYMSVRRRTGSPVAVATSWKHCTASEPKSEKLAPSFARPKIKSRPRKMARLRACGCHTLASRHMRSPPAAAGGLTGARFDAPPPAPAAAEESARGGGAFATASAGGGGGC
jgi:hypothetical protein